MNIKGRLLEYNHGRGGEGGMMQYCPRESDRKLDTLQMQLSNVTEAQLITTVYASIVSP